MFGFKKKPRIYKICSDCKYYSFAKGWASPDRCNHPKVRSENLIRKDDYHSGSCEAARIFPGSTCTKKARYFEPKE